MAGMVISANSCLASGPESYKNLLRHLPANAKGNGAVNDPRWR